MRSGCGPLNAAKPRFAGPFHRFPVLFGVRRPLWYRALIAAWGIWFTAALSNAGGLHTCPTHGGPGNHAAHASAAGNLASATHDAAMSGMDHGTAVGDLSSSASSELGSGSQDTQHSQNACTCLGSCCCAAPIASPEPAREAFVFTLVDAPPAEYPDVAAPSVEREYAHPFANGPPAQA